MARRSSKKTAISLFPFLAVLVCTMGALILLLLVTTRRMHKDQQKASGLVEHAWEEFQDPLEGVSPKAEAKPFVIALDETRSTDAAEPVTDFSISLLPPAPVVDISTTKTVDDPFVRDAEIKQKKAEAEQLQTQLDREREKRQLLIERIAAAKEELKNSDDESEEFRLQALQLVELEQQESELAKTLAQKQETLVQLRSELKRSAEVTAQADELLTKQESALVSLLQMSKTANEERGDAGTEATAIEFSGSTGTRRSPILVNVTKDGFEFLRSGVHVDRYKAERYPQRHEPLPAVAMAIHRHRNPNSSSKPPYIVLLVRPDGTPLFIEAKDALRRAGIHFGYELLDQNQLIAAGAQDAVETEIARSMRETCFRGRHINFGVAAEAKKEAEQRLARAKGPEAEIQIPGFGEQFFAGGHAPKTNEETRHPRGVSEPTPEESAFASSQGSQEEKTAALPDSTQPFSNSPGESFSSPFDRWNNADSSSTTARSNVQNDAEQQASSDVFHGDFAGRYADAPKETVTNKAADFTESGFGDEINVDVASLDPRQMLPTRRGLSDNLGIGGRQATEQLPHTNHQSTASHSGTSDSSIRTDPREPTSWPDSMTAIHESGSRTAGQAGDFSSSAVDSKVDGGGTASQGVANTGSGQTKAPEQTWLQKFLQQVESENEKNDPDPMLVALMQEGRRRSQVEEQQPSITTEPVVEHESTKLDRFAQFKANTTKREQYEPTTTSAALPEPTNPSTFEFKTPSLQIPDETPAVDIQPTINPFEAMAATADNSSQPDEERPVITNEPPPVVEEFLSFPVAKKTTPKEPAAAATASQPAAQPNNSNSAAPKETVYWVIKVYLSQTELQIGDFEPFETAGWTGEQRLALVLEAISATMQDVWANLRKDAVPAVRILVAPNAESIQQELSQSLGNMKILTRGVYGTSSGLTVDRFFSDAPLPQSQNSPTPAPANTAPLQNPAEPVPASPRFGGRSSI